MTGQAERDGAGGAAVPRAAAAAAAMAAAAAATGSSPCAGSSGSPFAAGAAPPPGVSRRFVGIRARTGTILLIVFLVGCASVLVLSWSRTRGQEDRADGGRERVALETGSGGSSDGGGRVGVAPGGGEGVVADEGAGEEGDLERAMVESGGGGKVERDSDVGPEMEEEEKRKKKEDEGVQGEEEKEAQGKNFTLKEVVDRLKGPDKNIIFASANEGYLDFLENWMASVSKFGYGSKVLFIAEDAGAYRYLKKKWPLQTVNMEAAIPTPAEADQNSSSSSSSVGGAPGEQAEKNRSAHTYGTGIYNVLVDRRPEYFKALIDLNVNFLYNDVDIVWLRDPFPLFTGEYDMWVQEDAMWMNGVDKRFKGGREPARPIRDLRNHVICTCFMYVRPTRRSKRLVFKWSRYIHNLAAKAGEPVLNQPAFNLALLRTSEREVSVGVLPIQLFPSGFLFFRCGGEKLCRRNGQPHRQFWDLVKKRGVKPVMVHNNWIKGHKLKRDRFKAHKLWFVPGTDAAKTRRN